MTKMVKPKVSILIPTYNGAAYLSECIESVLAQTYQDWELLILDDCSSDDTIKIAQSYARRDPRLSVEFNPKNLGLVGNWNRCVQLAKGEWIKFVFQDDWIEPECLEAMLDASTLNNSIVACQRNFAFGEDVSESTQQDYLNLPTLSLLFPDAGMISAEAYSAAVVDQLDVNFVGEPTAVMLHRSVFEKFGHFNPALIQLCDFEFWTRIAVHTGIAYVPRPLATFRVHKDSTSAKNVDQHDYGIELDILSMLHDFVFLPTYAPLRHVAMNYNPPLDLSQELGKRARGTRWVAIDAANRLGDQSSLHEWTRFSQSYPTLIPLADEESSGQSTLLKRIHRVLERHLLWRFKRQ